MSTVTMQVVEVESLEEEKEKCNCWVVERSLTWFVILLTVVVICLFCNEVLEMMHLRNQIVQTELNWAHEMLQQKQRTYRRHPPLWMP